MALRTAAEAETARTHDEWVGMLATGATIRRPTWGVVVHGVPIRSVRDLTSEKERQRIANQLLLENQEVWQVQTPRITSVAWLTNPARKNHGQKSSALVVEFTDPRHANEAISKGTVRDSAILTTVLYDRTARIRRCYNCQQYGHIGIVSSNKISCGLCAGSHRTNDCLLRGDTSQTQERKCAGCGDAHAAWSKGCRKYVAEMERVQAVAIHRQPFHRIPPYMQDLAPVGSDMGASSGPSSSSNSGGRSSTGQTGRTRSSSKPPAARSSSNVRFQQGSTPPHQSTRDTEASGEATGQTPEAEDVDMDRDSSGGRVPVEQGSGLEVYRAPTNTPAPETPAPRGRSVGARRTRSVTSSEGTRRSARQAESAVVARIAQTPVTPVQQETPPA